jgi:hypothetical protein
VDAINPTKTPDELFRETLRVACDNIIRLSILGSLTNEVITEFCFALLADMLLDAPDQIREHMITAFSHFIRELPKPREETLQ